ncbi:site-specific integrase [Acetobacteraceae bacterium KSS8]|uniref:Site-specific integrase n=1 Tax=Endosaccharibacter trunci TaxID=2812733 RepID=A0ABT1W516_9PROT|nr:site-specific integrase [Acetobacteraceae bacterium KSS8]
MLQAAINAGAAARSLPAPTLSPVKQKVEEKASWLTKAEQETLLASYPDHVKPIALTLCFQGTRSTEALRLDWRHVDFDRGTLFIMKSKSGRQRTIPMHPRVATALKNLWIARGRPDTGTVFLSRLKAAYSDTRKTGGNPLTASHRSACKTAGIVGFTPHGWRHHWASWMVMTGCDLVTLMRLGGWRTQKSVQRYAAVSADHMAEAILRLT